MSNFKRKIEIVESTTPPHNTYNWWFDLNTDQLKRYKRGKWNLYDYTWPTTALPPANEIWIELSYYDGGFDVNYVAREIFKNIGSVKEVKKTVREDESALVKIIFNHNLTNITVTESLDLSYMTDAGMTIIFPNLGNLNYAGDSVLFTGYEDIFTVDFIFGEIKSISGCLASAFGNSVYITIYSKDVPTIQSNLIECSSNEQVQISVPNALIKKYKSSTNWAQYDIVSID